MDINSIINQTVRQNEARMRDKLQKLEEDLFLLGQTNEQNRQFKKSLVKQINDEINIRIFNLQQKRDSVLLQTGNRQQANTIDLDIRRLKFRLLENEDSVVNTSSFAPLSMQNQVPKVEEVTTQDVPKVEEVTTQDVPKVEEVATQEVPKVEEVAVKKESKKRTKKTEEVPAQE